MTTNKAKTQARVSPRSGVAPPADKQFGKPNGNPRGHGFFKKEDTARYKLERMIEMDDKQLTIILNDEKASRFERDFAKVLLSQPIDKEGNYDAYGKWKIVADMINQVYGYPKQTIDNNNIEVSPILPKPVKKETKPKKAKK